MQSFQLLSNASYDFEYIRFEYIKKKISEVLKLPFFSFFCWQVVAQYQYMQNKPQSNWSWKKFFSVVLFFTNYFLAFVQLSFLIILWFLLFAHILGF